MDPDTVGRIEEWETRPVSDGYAGLRDLEADDFSGAITNGSGWLFMLNGRIIGVFNGTIEAFEGAGLTAHSAPDPSLPLLFSMQETGGETQGKYYTDDTPLAEVDRTLTEGSFTGYIELSENVLSGDYYVVYYGGRSLSAAFIGNAEQLITGDEAFDRANDEVGIYEVRSVELDVKEIPEPSPSGSTATTTGPPPEEPEEPEEEPASTDVEPDDQPGPSDVSIEEAEPPVTNEPVDADVDSVDAVEEAEPTTDESASEPMTSTNDTATEATQPETPTPQSEHSQADQDLTADDPDSRPAEQVGQSTQPEEPTSSSAEDPFSEEEAWRETRTIPALDPERSEEDLQVNADAKRQPRQQQSSEGRSRNATQNPSQSQPRSQSSSQQDPHQIQDLKAAIKSREGRIEELEAALEEVTTERDDLQAERDRLAQERDELQDRIERLESQLDSLTADSSASDDSGVSTELDPGEALTQTDVFIRYGSKGESTLENAHAGRADQEDVLSNLRLEEHTRFDSNATIVNGQPYLEFLDGTLQYRFVKWLVEDLIFEIQETNSQKRLRALYNVLPRFDRAEFDGTVTSRNEAGEEHSESFDVVIRDRMGQPLILADLNDARDPASGDMMSDLVTRATAAAESHDTIGAAFMVTASFFEPPALETADEATGGGLLDRDSKESFVKLGRKRGFHLCLAEARGDAFHVAVPEL